MEPRHHANGRAIIYNSEAALRGDRDRGRQNATYQQEEDTESQRSDTTNYERDVAILNHCFDDIERFIARLQYASAAYKELERRRRQRKSKKREAGGELCILRKTVSSTSTSISGTATD